VPLLFVDLLVPLVIILAACILFVGTVTFVAAKVEQFLRSRGDRS